MSHSIDPNLERRRTEASVCKRQRGNLPGLKPFWIRKSSSTDFFFLLLFGLGGISLNFACVNSEHNTPSDSLKEDPTESSENTTESANSTVEPDESSTSDHPPTESATSLSTDATSDPSESDESDDSSSDGEPSEIEVPVMKIDALIYGEELPQIWAVESTPIALSHCAATKLEGNYISIAMDAVAAHRAQAIVYAEYYHPITSFSSGGDELLSVVFLNDEKPPYLDADQWHHDATGEGSLIIPRAFYSEQPFYRIELDPSPHIVLIDPLATLDSSTQTVSIEYRILDIEGVVYSVREAHTIKHETMVAHQGDFAIWDCQR